MTHNIYTYILVMAAVTYLIRMLPLVLFKKPITSKFIKSFLFYVPFACLAAMTFPSIIYEPKHIPAGIAAFIVALIFAYRRQSLIVVALAACTAALIAELVF